MKMAVAILFKTWDFGLDSSDRQPKIPKLSVDRFA
jgi:hypothetical protein